MTTLTIPTVEPLEVIAGDTLTWKKSFSDYPASDSWVLSYALVKDGKIILIDDTEVTTDGDYHVVEVSAETSAAYTAGTYKWQAYVTLSGARYQVGEGTMEIKPNFATQSTGYDGRTTVKQTLDALEAMMLRKASKDQMSLTVPNGRRVDRLSPEQLLMWRDRMKSEYEKEKQADRIARGLGGGNHIMVRFR